MRKIINHLIQLQELAQICDEQKAAGGDGHLQQLTGSIASMKKQLPKDIRLQFEQLHRKDGIVIVPVAGQHCAGCGMQLPVSLIQLLRQQKDLQSCPNCARILYCAASAPKSVPQRTRRTAPRKVGVARFSAASLMVPNLQAANMEECIQVLSAKMEAEGFVDDAGKLAELALRREAVLSTVVDHGLAFPHVRGIEGGGLTFVLGTNATGLTLDDGVREPTQIVFFVVIPTAASPFYLKLLSGLTQTFRKPDARKTLLAETDPEKMWKAVIKLTRTTIK